MRNLPALLAAVVLAAPALAFAERLPLSEQPQIRDGLISVAIAYEIGEGCDSLNARMLRGIAFLGSLRTAAQRMGYTRAEISSFMDDRAEKARLEAMAWERFAELGGVRNDHASYCAVGRAQMAEGSQIGQLLR